MGSGIQFINTSPEEFKRELMYEIVKLIKPEEEEVLLTQREIADFYRVTPQTIIKWQKKGKINAYAIEGEVRYKKSELISSLRKI